ncbi:MAG TPA: hypothetical protein VFJ19_19040 [Nocardioidaceae bacterium]|nr:hypothetical protein [Nocardioidaceae bacterium]
MSEPAGPAPRRVLLHVGVPKTGTSFVQDLLFANRDVLAAQGISYPADRFDAHFLAALDLMELPWGGLETQAVGAWERLAEQVRAWPGTTIVSHEILARASRPQVARALASFGDAEVHLVVSARDLVRQIPAEWQENVKHRRTVSYRAFLDQITDPERRSELASWFWAVQEVPDILARWGESLPAGHVHVVTVPKPGAPRDLLWRRFAAALELDPDDFRPDPDHANPSMGVPETALVRRINARVNDGVLANADYRRFVRELLAHRTMASRTDSPRLGLPPEVRAWAAEVSRSWVETLGATDYQVVGSLDDLLPDPGDQQTFDDPDLPDESQVHDAALAAVVALLEEATRLAHSEEQARAERQAAYAELEASRGPWFRTKRRLVAAAERNPVAGFGLAAYRRVRGRSSRSA